MTQNVLVIISDEHRKDAMGCAGHPIVRTPNLDALAARGTMFTNAYTPSPMCVPTRAALATGTYVHQNRYWDSATAYDGRVPSWMHVLEQAGVETTSIGKLHFRSGEDDTGFGQEILPMHVVGGVGWAVGLLRDDPPPYDAAQELAEQVGAGNSSYTDYDRAITRAACEWLEAKAESDKPWVSFVSLVSPHYPLTAPQDFYDLYRPEDMPLPIGQHPDHPELDNVAAFFAYGQHFDEARMREAIASYFGLVTFMDDCVGQILAALEASGQAENTTVIYISDHGEMLGDHGFWTKQVMYEASAGVPMIVAGRGVPSGKHVATAANLVDLAPTVVGITGAGPGRDDWPGLSLIDMANAPDDPGRTGFSEYHDGGSKTGTFMVRWENWKYVHYVGQPPQLFDLQDDPNELTDRGQHSGARYETARSEGLRRLHEICDPEAVNAQCFADQALRIEALGGRKACETAYVFNHTPTPKEQEGLAL